MPATTSKTNSAASGALFRLAVVGAVLCAVVCGVMLVQIFRLRTDNPLKSPKLIELKTKLADSPEDDQLKAQIRALDLQLRERYFQHVTLNRTGAWLGALGAVIFLFGAKQSLRLRRTPPMPEPKTDKTVVSARSNSLARAALLSGALVVAAAFATVAAVVRSPLPETAAELQKLFAPAGDSAAAVVDAPSLADIQSNWPWFRGWDGNAFAPKASFPLTWDIKTGAGVLWKSAVPTAGLSSPIVWKNRVFLSGGNDKKREVMCFDADSGSLLWQKEVGPIAGAPSEVPEIPEQCGYAAPTMATDGRRVYAIFATGELAAFTVDGQLAWAKHLGILKNEYGHAVSLVMWQHRLIVQLDQGKGGPQSASKLIAYDGATGKELWKQPRQVASAWASPIVVDAGGKAQIVTLAVPNVISYAADTGTELWRAELLEGEVTPSPVSANGVVYIVSPSNTLVGLRADGKGNVTNSVLWKAEDNIPDVTSPATNGELVFIATSSGMVTCFDAKDGKKQWEKDLNNEVQASPTVIGNRLCVFTTKGIAVILEAGRQFKELGQNTLDDKFYASPAVANNRLFVRGVKNLYCLGEKSK